MARQTARLDVKKLGPLLRKLGDQAKEALARGALSGAMRGVQHMQTVTAQDGIFDRGTYRLGWKARPTGHGATLFNDAVHAPIIEDGRRPGARMPPVAVIQRWAERKLHLTDRALEKAVAKSGKGKKTKALREAAKIDARGIAFLMARAIGRRGIKGKHVLRNAVPALIKIVQEEVERELTAEVKKRLKR